MSGRAESPPLHQISETLSDLKGWIGNAPLLFALPGKVASPEGRP